MHDRCYQHIQAAALEVGLLAPGAVLELGSYNVNGSIRPVFAADRYVGIDRRAGPDVDQVVDVADFDGEAAFDLVVTCGAMEHSATPADFIRCAERALRPGGYILIHAEGDRPHNQDGGHELGEGEAYTPITEKWLRGELDGWEAVSIWSEGADVYARASWPGGPEPELAPVEAKPAAKARKKKDDAA